MAEGDTKQPQQSPSPFRQKSLDRLSSPERLDHMLKLVRRRSWVPLAAMTGLVGVLVVWSIFGSIPITVEGKGILVHPRHVDEVEAPGSGRIQELSVAVGARIAAGDELGRIALPELEKQLEQQRAKLGQLTALGRAARVIGSGSGSDPGDRLSSALQLADDLRREAEEALRHERRILEEQHQRAREISEGLGDIFDRSVKAKPSGLISEQDLMRAQEDYLDSLTRISDIQTRLVSLRTRELELEDQHLVRLQRIADLEIDLESWGQQIADVDREIERLQVRIAEEGRIVSKRAGTVIEINVSPGEHIERGERVGSVAIERPGKQLTSLTYFTVRDGKRIEPGQKIQITPDTADRARHGGILGEVIRVSPYPVTLAQAGTEIGNREMAETLLSGGYRMQVEATLQVDAETPSRLLWSSSRGEDLEISPGLTTTARVTIESRRPIGFVLPILRQSTGVE